MPRGTQAFGQSETRAERAFHLVERALLHTLFEGKIFNPVGNATAAFPVATEHLQMVLPLNKERSARFRKLSSCYPYTFPCLAE